MCNGATDTSTERQRRRSHLAHLPLIRIELAIAMEPGLAQIGPEIGAIIGQAIGNQYLYARIRRTKLRPVPG